MNLDTKQIKELVLKFEDVGLPKNIIPDGVKDPELLMRALLKKFCGELETSRARVQKARTEATKQKSRAETAEFVAEEHERTQDLDARRMRKLVKELGGYEAKVAFLGDKWETLTGEVNTMLIDNMDHHTARRQAMGELKVAKEDLFDFDLKNKKLTREFNAMKLTLAAAEELNDKWSVEVLDMRYADENTEKRVAVLNVEIDRLTAQIRGYKDATDRAIQEKNDFANQLAAASKRLQEADVTCDKLNKNVVRKTKELTVAERVVVETEAVVVVSCVQKEHLSDSLYDAQCTAKEVKAELKSVKKRAFEAEGEVAKLQRLLNKTEEDLKSYRTKFRDSQNAKVKTEIDLRASREETEAAKEEASMLGRAVDNITASLNKMEERYFDEKQQVASLKKQLTERTSALHEVTEESHRHEETAHTRLESLTQTRGTLKEVNKVGSQLSQDLRKTEKILVETEEEKGTIGDLVKGLHKDLLNVRDQLDVVTISERKLKAEVADTKQALTAAVARGDDFESSYKRSVEEVKGLRADLKAAGQVERKLHTEVRTKHGELKHVEKEVRDIGFAYNDVAVDLKERQVDVHQANKEIDKLKAELKGVKIQLMDALKAEHEAIDLRDAAFASAQEARANVKKKEAETWTVTKALNGTKQQYTAVQSDIEALNVSYNKIGSDFIEKRVDLKQEKSKVDKLEKEVKLLKTQLSVVEKEAAEFKGITEIKSADLIQVRKGHKEVTAQFWGLNADVKKAKTTLSRTESDLHFLNDKVHVKISEAESAELRLRDAEAAKRRLTVELEDMSKQLRKANHAVDNVAYTNTQISKELSTAEEKRKDAEARAKQLHQDLRASKQTQLVAEKSAKEQRENVHTLMEEARNSENELTGLRAGMQMGGGSRLATATSFGLGASASGFGSTAQSWRK